MAGHSLRFTHSIFPCFSFSFTFLHIIVPFFIFFLFVFHPCSNPFACHNCHLSSISFPRTRSSFCFVMFLFVTLFCQVFGKAIQCTRQFVLIPDTSSVPCACCYMPHLLIISALQHFRHLVINSAETESTSKK